ncbi:MAG: hypothetical protein JEY94_08565 [Melioribacteraceae bacterium]|nr:hypothetical protein [Melioribacteraceae bacterium]
MKKILLILGMVFCCTNIQAQEAKKYAVKSGYIKIEISGNTKGTKELWWDDYGDKSCELEKSTTTTKMFGIESTDKKNMLTIIVKDRYWVIDYLDNSGTKGKVPFYEDAKKSVNSMSKEEQEEFSNEILLKMGGEKEGTETVNGYKCDVFKIMGSKSWIYKGIAIKSEVSILGITSNEIFTEFVPGKDIPSSKFVAPKNINYKDLAKVKSNLWNSMDNN